MSDNIVDFVGGATGQWRVLSLATVAGEPIVPCAYLNVTRHLAQPPVGSTWTLTGFTSNVRYAEKRELDQLKAIQPDLGRPNALQATMIPIRKSEEWWNLAQDERRKIMETSSKHTQTGLAYLPAIARKLYHCRDIGGPFDFITWFEYDPADTPAFDELVYTLRKTEEWQYVNREVDIRLTKASIDL